METVFEDQMVAALSTGMSYLQTIRYAVLFQTMRIMIPAWNNNFYSLTKNATLLGLIVFLDLTGASKTIAG